MSYLSIPAEDVKVGDQINMGVHFAINPNHRWADVKKVRKVDACIVVTAGGCDTWLHPKESVSIQRFDGLADRI